MSTPGPDDDARTPARGRRRGLAAVAVAAAALAVAAAVGLGTGRGGEDPPPPVATSPAAPTTGAAPSGTPAPDPAAPPEEGPLSEAPAAPGAVAADELPPSLAPVALDATAEDPGGGVSATLEDVEAVDGRGVGPGQVAGPALRITVRVANASPSPVDLDAVVVTASSGADEVPASALNDPSAAPFTGSLDPGEAAEGVYVFTVPPEARDLVTVSVGHRADAPFLVFRGAAD